MISVSRSTETYQNLPVLTPPARLLVDFVVLSLCEGLVVCDNIPTPVTVGTKTAETKRKCQITPRNAQNTPDSTFINCVITCFKLLMSVA